MVKRKLTFLESVSPLLVMTVLVFFGFVVFKVRIEAILLASTLYAAFIGRRAGLSWKDMETAIGNY